jgi:tetratricopeptide (TPR) repeat protein
MNQGVLHMAGRRPDEALPLLERAQQLRLAHAADGIANDAALQRDIGMGYYNLALAQLALSESEAAQSRLTEAIAAFDELARREPQDFDARRRLALCRRMLGDVLASGGDIDEAVVEYELARDALLPLVERNPDVPDYAAELAGVRMNLGAQRQGQGDLAAAIEEMEAATELLRKINASDAPTPRYRRDLGVALRAAGQILMELDRTDDARARLDESRTVFEQLVAEFPADENYATELEHTESALGELDSI